MTSYADRSVIQLPAGRRAVATGLTVGKWELFIVLDDTTGDPVGVLAGDGAQVGGFRMAEDALYALLDGSRNVTGTQQFDAGVTVLGTLSVASVLQQLTALALFLQHNTLSSNADGARRTTKLYGGQKADGTVHYLHELRVEHDGTGDDQNARVVHMLNDGNDGLVPSAFSTWTGVDGLADFVGEVRTPVGRMGSARSGSGRQTLSGTTVATITMAALLEDTGFSWNPTNDEWDLSFDGNVTLAHSLWAEVAVGGGTRTGFQVWIEHDTGSGYAEVLGTRRGDYVRSTTEGGTVALSDYPLAVSSGDKLRLRGVCEDATPAAVQLQSYGALFSVTRRQGSS